MFRATGDLAPGEQLLVDSATQTTAQSYPCKPVPYMCLRWETEKEVRAALQKACPGTAVVRGIGATDCGQTSIGLDNWQNYDPCKLKGMPTCGKPSPPLTTQNVLAPPIRREDVEDEGDEEDSSFVVGGLLALLVVGGVAYAVMKKRKKGKR